MRPKQTFTGIYCHQVDQIYHCKDAPIIVQLNYVTILCIIHFCDVSNKVKRWTAHLQKNLYLKKYTHCLLISFFFCYSKSGDLTVSLCFIVIMALSQQLFLLFVLSSWQTLTSASKASSFCLTVNRWNSASTSLRYAALFFHWQTICSGLQVSCWCVTSRTFGHNVSRTIVLLRVSSMLFWIVGEAAWCFCCVVSPQHSTVWSAYLVLCFLW